MFHLTARVAWHDSRWNGRVCEKPSCNSFCTALKRVREERDDAHEDALAGRSWSEIDPDALPPCKAESGAFMNPDEWTRRFKHPYAMAKKVAETHGHLLPTLLKIPPYSTGVVPFAWMLRSEQEAIDATLAEPLPPDETPPMPTSWVFGRARQEALLKVFFGRLGPEQSIVFFYCKEGQPLGDTISRLVMGVGRVTAVAPAKSYDVSTKKPSYLMWDRQIRHSIRPDEADGFLLPYHDYLESTGSPVEDARRLELLHEIAIPVDPAHMRAFSYGAELAGADVALSTLVRCLESVRLIRAHGISKGPWERREEWLNAQIALVWKDRGAFPGLGPVLEALGMRLGTAPALELVSAKLVASDADPWPLVDKILRGKKKPPQQAYQADLETVRDTWTNLSDERRALALLLSRFALSPAQALRWFDQTERAKATSAKVSDRGILENPYRMSEVDLGDGSDLPVSVGMIDRGLLADSTLAVKHPVPSPSTVLSPNDPRRLRAAIVAVLRRASENGDSLLSLAETLRSVAKLDLAHPCAIGSDWPTTNRAALEGVVDIVDVGAEGHGSSATQALQLAELKLREQGLRAILARRRSANRSKLEGSIRYASAGIVVHARAPARRRGPRTRRSGSWRRIQRSRRRVLEVPGRAPHEVARSLPATPRVERPRRRSGIQHVAWARRKRLGEIRLTRRRRELANPFPGAHAVPRRARSESVGTAPVPGDGARLRHQPTRPEPRRRDDRVERQGHPDCQPEAQRLRLATAS